MSPERELLEQWLERVRRDLRCAEVDLAAQPPLTEDACFHCQQAVEKALKAFLVYRGVEFEKTHDIDLILDLCTEADGAFEQLRDQATRLTVYAVRFRYPDVSPAPSAEQAAKELEVAKRVWRFVLDRLGDQGAQDES